MANATDNSLYLRTSRYVQGGVTETQNNRIEWWERAIFEKEPSSDITYVVENIYAGRLDIIASIFYNEPRYWWIIAQYNNILDPFIETFPGRVLQVPSKDRITLMMTGRQGGIDSKRETLPMIPPVIV